MIGPDDTTTRNDPHSQRKVPCPYCGSTATELFSLFGQQLLTLQYYCTTCRTPFEYVKDDVVPPLPKPYPEVDPGKRIFAPRKEGQA